MERVNINARANDSRIQESMVYWALADVSHQNLHGSMGGFEFLIGFVNNVQVPLIQESHEQIPKLEATLIPKGLKEFLIEIKIPYLLPEEPSTELRSSFVNICDFGHCYRCPNNLGIDIGFQMKKGGQISYSYVECKYTDETQKEQDVAYYIANAKKKNSPLTFFVSFRLGNNIKRSININPKSLRKGTQTPSLDTLRKYLEGDVDIDKLDQNNRPTEDDIKSSQLPKRPQEDFNINIYSIFYNKSKSLVLSTLLEYGDSPDGVFIIVETNFKVEKI